MVYELTVFCLKNNNYSLYYLFCGLFQWFLHCFQIVASGLYVEFHHTLLNKEDYYLYQLQQNQKDNVFYYFLNQRKNIVFEKVYYFPLKVRIFFVLLLTISIRKTGLFCAKNLK